MRLSPALLAVGLLITALGLGAPRAQPATQPLPGSPERILSLAPHITETLFALGVGERLVGRTDFCLWPAEAQSIPSIGGFLNSDWERIYALHPDLVVRLEEAHDLYAPLAALDCPQVTVRSDTIRDVREGIRAMAISVGVPERGEELIDRMDQQLDRVARQLMGSERLRTLILIGREPGTLQGLFAADPGSFVSELVSRAGAVNALSDTLGAFPEISREIILGANPEVIIDTCLETQGADAEAIARELAIYRRELSDVDAVANDRVILWTDPHLTIPGPSMAEQVEALARAIHPERFTEAD
ncbi:ABC transporter substrate-binding protein [Candidatus Sumerlaeota bacterium]|nr:ABC transporter substrate-binding protein [Candidatus Sumerlaeota bacterium]